MLRSRVSTNCKTERKEGAPVCLNQRDELIRGIEGKLTQSAKVERLFAMRWVLKWLRVPQAHQVSLWDGQNVSVGGWHTG